MTPGDYVTLKPALATRWARTPDGMGWRFTLARQCQVRQRQPDDRGRREVLLDRVRFIKYQASQYVDQRRRA